jgi:CBS domain-containing protein
MKTGYTVGDAMTKSPVSVSENTCLADCCALMKKHKVGSLVIREGKNLKGMVTSEQIIHSIAEGLPMDSTIVANIMTNDLPQVSPELDIHEALVKMNELEMRQLPVINDDNFVGLLTMKDILKIEPALFDLVVDRFDIREEEDKPVYKTFK